jgi:hypothetical protein
MEIDNRFEPFVVLNKVEKFKHKHMNSMLRGVYFE